LFAPALIHRFEFRSGILAFGTISTEGALTWCDPDRFVAARLAKRELRSYVHYFERTSWRPHPIDKSPDLQGDINGASDFSVS
jgi:hypothetical protein